MSFDYLTTHTSLSPTRRGFAPGFVNYKKGALDSQPQVIKFTCCLPMVSGSLRVFRLLPPLKLIAMILLKVALNTKNQSNPFKTLSCGGGYLGILIYIKSYNFVWDQNQNININHKKKLITLLLLLNHRIISHVVDGITLNSTLLFSHCVLLQMNGKSAIGKLNPSRLSYSLALNWISSLISG